MIRHRLLDFHMIASGLKTSLVTGCLLYRVRFTHFHCWSFSLSHSFPLCARRKVILCSMPMVPVRMASYLRAPSLTIPLRDAAVAEQNDIHFDNRTLGSTVQYVCRRVIRIYGVHTTCYCLELIVQY